MKYTDTHEWVDFDPKEKIATIGITEYAQKELGDLVYIEMPKVGQELAVGEEVVILESTKAAIDLYTPLTGKIVAVNQSLQEMPEYINRAPQGEGWLYKIQPVDLSEYDQLLEEADYQKLLRGYSD